MTTQGALGDLVCVYQGCAVAGYPTTRAACVSCGRPTRSRTDAGLDIPAPPPPRPAQVDTLGKGMEIGSRVFYGGFWVLVTILGVLGGLAILVQGNGVGLPAIAVGVLAGFYARYIFRGGRFRIMFW